jgi:hypothetical protein
MDLRNISKDMIVVVDSRFPCLPFTHGFRLILTDVLLQGKLRDQETFWKLDLHPLITTAGLIRTISPGVFPNCEITTRFVFGFPLTVPDANFSFTRAIFGNVCPYLYTRPASLFPVASIAFVLEAGLERTSRDTNKDNGEAGQENEQGAPEN